MAPLTTHTSFPVAVCVYVCKYVCMYVRHIYIQRELFGFCVKVWSHGGSVLQKAQLNRNTGDGSVGTKLLEEA